jgi:arginyl-tRNA synthetase
MDLFKKHIEAVLRNKGIAVAGLEVPANQDLGDFALPCFILAKEQKKSPIVISKEISESIVPDDFIEKVNSVGPYVNFFIRRNKLSEYVIGRIESECDDYGRMIRNDKTIMVEFSSPNTNKPLHLGHMRNNFLGDSISRIYDACGNRVIKTCLVNDRGVHICKSMLAYKNWGNNSEPDKKSDHFVGDWYVRFAKEAQINPSLESDAQEMLVSYENNDPETISLWKKMNQWVFDGFLETYKTIGISFDKTYYESDLFGSGREIILDNLAKGIFTRDEKGNVIAPLEKYGLPNKVVLRADGTTVYVTQDIFLAVKKFQDYSLDKSIYVVGSEQILHFQVLFKILELLGFGNGEKLYHLSYGMVNLPEGKMKSREGTVVDADDLIEEVKTIARDEIHKRYSDLDDFEVDRRAHIIAIAALKFFILKQDPTKDMVYNPKESVSFEGETGPYILYTYARIMSILSKAEGFEIGSSYDSSKFDDKERQMLVTLARLPEIIYDAYNQNKPSIIARYAIDVAQSFNEFYSDHQILKAEIDVKNSRLHLINAVSQVLKNSLNLLGIETLEQM